MRIVRRDCIQSSQSFLLGYPLNFARFSLPTLALFWSGLLFLMPLLLVQALYVRRFAVRLPDGAPPSEGRWRKGWRVEKTDIQSAAAQVDPLAVRVLGLGDSVIVVTGLSHMSEYITAAIARRLSEQCDGIVKWETCGVNGYRAADLESFAKTAHVRAADFIVISIGVNDVTGLTSLVRWQSSMIAILSDLQRICRGKIVLIGLPPMENFTALPAPLSWLLGVRAAMLGKTLPQLGDLMQNVVWINPAAEMGEGLLADDGYHPNEVACVAMAENVAESIGSKGDTANES
ncbi:MAG: lysophospholipase L1-like esterase [Candidatus Azotimanducaceae bacterium]|jgi:lysophospholipase L1-like esterase